MPKKSTAVLPARKKSKNKFDPCSKLVQMRIDILSKGSNGHRTNLSASAEERTGDCADVAARKADTDWTITLNAIEKARLKRVNQAIARIDEGTYGTCTQCGEKIAAKRLEKHPDVPTCIECQQQIEDEQKLRAHNHMHPAYAAR